MNKYNRDVTVKIDENTEVPRVKVVMKLEQNTVNKDLFRSADNTVYLCKDGALHRLTPKNHKRGSYLRAEKRRLAKDKELAYKPRS